MQHAGNVLVRQAVGGFDIDVRLHTTALLFGADTEQAVGVHCEGHTDARRTRSHGRYAAQFKAGQAAAVSHQITLTLHHMQGQRGLAVLVRGEVLGHGGGNGLVARNDALDQTAHGFNPQREWNHIEQQQIIAPVIAGQLVGRNRSPQGDHFIGVEVGQWLLAKKFSNSSLDLRHARGAAHHHHALNVVFV